MEKRKFRIISVLADIVILAISFLAMAAARPAGLKTYVPSHLTFFAGLLVMWLIVSLTNGKMHRGRIINFTTLYTRVLSSNFISISITALVMYFFREYSYSRTVVFGTALLATVLELLFGSVYIAYKKALLQDYEDFDRFKPYKRPSEYDLVMGTNGNGFHHEDTVTADPGIASAIERECGKEMAECRSQHHRTKTYRPRSCSVNYHRI